MTKTVLVTGCSTGIGRETARVFSEDGWAVYATARDRSDIQSLGNQGCKVDTLDVTRTADIERVVDRIITEQGRIDCLVNNAAYGQFGPIEDVPAEAARAEFDVNLFGPYRLVRAVLPHMREQWSGTIINVSSAAGRLAMPGIGIYSGSKFALEGFTDALRGEISKFGIDVVLVEPDFVATDFYSRAVEELEDLEHSNAYEPLYHVLGRTEALDHGGLGVMPPRRVAETVLDAATDDTPDTRYPLGPFTTATTAVRVLLPDKWRDRIVQFSVRLASHLLERTRRCSSRRLSCVISGRRILRLARAMYD